MKVMVTRRAGQEERYAVAHAPGPGAPGLPAPDAPAALLHGSVLAAGQAAQGPAVPTSLPAVVVAGGPDAGGVFPLPPGRWVDVGRDQRCDITIRDQGLSRRHVRIRQERDGVSVQDLGSTNGIAWELGGESETWRPGDRLLLGGSSLVLLRRCPAPATTVDAGDGTVQLVPRPRVEAGRARVALERPPAPVPRTVRRPSAWSWALPLALAVAISAVLRMPWLMLFGLLGPAMALGQHLGDRRLARQEHVEASEHHRDACRSTEQDAGAALRADLTALRTTDPGLLGLSRTVGGGPTTRLWECADEPLRAVLGEHAAPSAVSLDGAVLEHQRAPLVVDLTERLVVAGAPGVRDALVRSLVLQLTTRHPPSHLALQVDPDTLPPGWDLLAWLPHTTTGDPPGGVPTLRWGRDLVLRDDPHHVPAGVALVTLLDERQGVLHRPGEAPRPFAPQLLGLPLARQLARTLAPLRPGPGPGAAGASSPTGPTRLGELLPWPTAAAEAAEGWRTGGALAVPVGVDPAGHPVLVDLVTDGPHALVAGTTGSGKSELLRTLVVGWAVRCSPAQLSLLLVDYKGGSSLGDCAALPHVSGLVTDLDPHLAERVLVSLQAELRRREEVLQRVGARDIRDGTAHGLSRLVVVIDEFRVLAEEVPEVLTGLVRLAAVGRSLGVHLVLATQRPAGVVSADLRANVNLRIALRVRDTADSHDVLECADAAHLPEGRPGLALLRTGADAPRTVQVAVAAPAAAAPDDPAPRGAGRPAWLVEDHPDAWSARRAVEASRRPEAPAPPEDAVADLSAVLRVAAEHEGSSAPTVWRPPLPDQLGTLADHPDAWVMTDRPERQASEPLRWSADHHLGIVGAARTGRTTALRSVAGRVPGAWFVVLDLGRALDATELRAHPACCAWVAPDDLAHGMRVLDRLLEVVLDRQSRPAARHTPVLLLVDGWDRFVDLYGEVDRGRAVEVALRILREGPSAGVVAVLTGDRSLLVGRMATLLTETWALRLNDPGDLLLTGLRARQLPRDQPPGRVVRTRDGVVGQVLLPSGAQDQEWGMPWPQAPPALQAPQAPPVPAPFRCVALPRRWSPDPEGAPASPTGWALGGDEATPLAPPTGTVLVLGPPGSGRSRALAALTDARGGAALTVAGSAPPDDPDLRAALAGAGPAGLVVVDDAHLLAGTTTEDLLLDHVTRHRSPLLVAADLDTAGSMFRGLVPHAARARTGVVLQPTSPGQGGLLGVSLPVGDLPVPGRGVLVHRGRCTRLQVVAPP